MLTSIKKATSSFFTKVLIGLIILPFVFWGMGDVFRTGNQNVLVNIDAEKIGVQNFVNYLSQLNLTDEQRNRLFEISNKCPIHKALTNTVKINSKLI